MGYPFDTVQTLLIRTISNLVGFLETPRTHKNLPMAAREVIARRPSEDFDSPHRSRENHLRISLEPCPRFSNHCHRLFRAC